MAKIHSAVGDSSFQSGQKKFIIEDEGMQPSRRVAPTEINPAMAASLRSQAQQQQEQRETRVIQEARRRIELITGLGRKTRDVLVDLEGNSLTFTLRTLKTFEQNALAQEVERANRITLRDGSVGFTPTSLYKIKIEALGHSLYLIDGQSVDIVLGTANDSYDEKLEARKDLLKEMEATLVDHLFLQYELLAQESRDGYLPKTEEDVKEVVETIRKSGEDT